MAPKGSRQSGGTGLVSSDFTAYLHEKAQQLAPGDVRTLLGQRKEIAGRAKRDGDRHPRLPRQVDLAFEIVAEHFAARCPQIPYYTIALLSVALLYFAEPIDVIPDWIAGIGTADDALVMELAFVLAKPGVDRYCAWKDVPTTGLVTEPAAPAKASPPARRASSSRSRPRSR